MDWRLFHHAKNVTPRAEFSALHLSSKGERTNPSSHKETLRCDREGAAKKCTKNCVATVLLIKHVKGKDRSRISDSAPACLETLKV